MIHKIVRSFYLAELVKNKLLFCQPDIKTCQTACIIQMVQIMTKIKPLRKLKAYLNSLSITILFVIFAALCENGVKVFWF